MLNLCYVPKEKVRERALSTPLSAIPSSRRLKWFGFGAANTAERTQAYLREWSGSEGVLLSVRLSRKPACCAPRAGRIQTAVTTTRG